MDTPKAPSVRDNLPLGTQAEAAQAQPRHREGEGNERKRAEGEKKKSFLVSTPQKEKSVALEPPVVPGPTDRRQPLLLGAPLKEKKAKAAPPPFTPKQVTERLRKKRTIAPKTGRVREERKARVVELKQMGARWSIKKIAGTQYVYARVWVSGIRKEISLGQLNEELKRIFKEEDIQL